jgi:polyhydroxyalkanoate synthesis repressor PhaR
MTRRITRYRGGSRKLYDTVASRYLSLDEIPALIRRGDVVRVVDNVSGADVTAQVLAQVISESQRRGVTLLTADALHEIIRSGERLIAAGLRHLRRDMVRFATPARPARRSGRDRRRTSDVTQLRRGLHRLSRLLTEVEER